MSNTPIYIGAKKASFIDEKVEGKLIEFENENYYKISNFNLIRPFFMSIISNANHWMFLSSNGGLSAGRKDSDNALFPYYTDDKITESSEITGSKTILKIYLDGKIFLWEPFSNKYEGVYKITRNLYKNSLGNKIVFEEINDDLGITYRYQWQSSEKYGFVKKSTLINNTNQPVKITVLDGIQNIMPYGVSANLQNASSNLVDAYKKAELESDIGLGIFALSAIIVDKAEPSEALKATIAWSTGLKNSTYLLSSLQLDNFRKGLEITQEVDVKAEKGAYFLCADVNLASKSEKNWFLIADVNQTIVSINNIKNLITHNSEIEAKIIQDVELGSKKLWRLTASADGLQFTANKLRNTRHFSNTLFNIMRGGIFDNNYQIEKDDFVTYIAKANKEAYSQNKVFLELLPSVFSNELLHLSLKTLDDVNFKRLCIEYLPLKFSRRHGDPSRPWNKFSINTTSEIDGSKILDYEGNWRDIFQNWEALAHSYPFFIEGMIHKFLNASTFEGYNPYRVTKDGFDWETIEPDNPWSYIGYWGDHQIIYLLKFLEFAEDYFPNQLATYFNQDIFVYANVPYKIKSYQDILKNPKDTITFDTDLHDEINDLRAELGADGTLLKNRNNRIYNVNLIEKLLATVLSKVSNFIPEAGIWMNTQRPEWNDANNALVGNGVSMVTLYYLHRFINFFEGIVKKSSSEKTAISSELKTFFNALLATLQNNEPLLSGKISDLDRKSVTDGLGNAASNYRENIYKNHFSGHKKTIDKKELLQFFRVTNKFIEHAIDANKRKDNLYHAYTIMTLKNDHEMAISYLPEMLEGQVAVLSSGYLNAHQSLEVLNALKASALFRPNQYSYILYPNKELPRFCDKNNIDSKRIEESVLLKQLEKDNNSQIVEKDIFGNYHFNGQFNNANSLLEALNELPETYQELVKKDTSLLLTIFEDVFNHKSFTGRSGTFFGYEGLGSIYWHMVSKLLLAVQESCLAAINNQENPVTIGHLLDHYYEINEGIGVHKSPELYGAFPTDPYSHTPGGKGAQQPGMTGQVKEDILSRFGELGVFVKEGKLQFKPSLLRTQEFLKDPLSVSYTDVFNVNKDILLEKDTLCFTYCQIPIIYKLAETLKTEVVFNNNTVLKKEGLILDAETSLKVFNRTGEISQIVVSINK